MRGARKLVVYLVGVAVSTAALFTGHLDGIAYQNILIWLTGIYVGGNVANYWQYARGGANGGPDS